MMKTVMTAYRVKVNRCCAQKYCCSQWQMAAGLKNAGLQNGGVVRQRETKEIVIK